MKNCHLRGIFEDGDDFAVEVFRVEVVREERAARADGGDAQSVAVLVQVEGDQDDGDAVIERFLHAEGAAVGDQ